VRAGRPWLCFSFDDYRYRDPALTPWVQRLGDILFGNGAPSVAALRERFPGRGGAPGRRAAGARGVLRGVACRGHALVVRPHRSVRQRVAVFTGGAGALRCDHVVRFLGMTILRLPCRMRPRPA
jgi:hypothetical protein